MTLDFGWEKPIVMQDAKHDEVPVAYIQVGVYRMALLVIYYMVVGFLPLPQSPDYGLNYNSWAEWRGYS